MTPPALECRALCKIYRNGYRALDDISLLVPPGSLVLVGGPSGSGKTTLLSLLATLDRPTSGAVFFSGEDVTRYSDSGRARIRRRIGFVAQDFALIPGLPAWENVTYPMIPRGIHRTERRRVAAAVLDQLGLGRRMTAKPRTLSGGEQQRVAIARALAGSPEILIADEPTSNLDDESASRVMATMAESHRAGATVILSSHDPRLSEKANQVVRLAMGKLTEMRSVDGEGSA